jgi:hypothetical protein
MASRQSKAKKESEFTALGQVPFNKLHFDPQNPRRDPMEDEAEVRRVLCEDEKVVKLAEHIASNGQNPLARVALLDHPQLPGHFIVPEGNRRLCAMQLLRDPERAPTPASRRTFERLSTGGRAVPDALEAVWFRDRDVARPWLSVNHEGEQGGVGTVAWGTAEKARFNRQGAKSITRPKNPNVQALHLVDYAVARGLITSEQRDLIALTTLTRYLPSVRSALGLLNSEDCTTNAVQEQFDAALRRFLADAVPSSDALEPSPVRSRSKAKDWKGYAEQLRQDGVSPVDRTRQPYDPATAGPAQPAGKKSRPRSATNPDKRKWLIPSDFVVPLKESVLLRMVIEGKRTDCDEQRFAANYLIRAILERVVHLYAKRYGIGLSKELEPVIAAVAAHTAKRTNPPSRGVIGTLRTAGSSQTAKYGPQALGNGVHGGRIPSASDNRSNWETLQPALQYLLNQLK